jgi:SpoVK/Ycf46/Vps4 family AAA+-type ATPase
MTNKNENLVTPRKTIKKPYIRTIQIHASHVEMVVEDALYAKILDEEILMDKVALDFMIDNLANTFKNSSPSNTIPRTIVISSESFKEFWQKKPQEELQKVIPRQSVAKVHEEDNQSSPFSNSKLNYQKDDSSSAEGEAKKHSPHPSNTIKDENQEMDKTLSLANKNDDYLKVYKPRYTFDDVYVDPIFKRRIVSALILAKQKKKIYEEWGLLKTLKNPRPLILNFYGPPGTGKSMMAEAIANYLDKDVFLVNYSELESGTTGETPKNIVRCFKRATEANAVLIFDEADSFLGKRLTNVSSAADYSINVTRSVMLIELEKFEGVIVFTTNFISNYDIAFKRRILASLEFRLPDEKGRAHIWNTHIPKELPLSAGISPMALAYKYGGTTGADIKDIVLFAAVNCLEKGRERISWEDFDEAYQAVKNRYNVV